MAESLTGEYRDFSELVETAASRRLELLGRAERLPDVLAQAREMPPFDEAADAIDLLSRAGVACGALSNSSTLAVESLVSKAGLDLAPIVGTDRIRAFKPDPRVYEAAIASSEARPEEIVLVTAHSWDALGARRAGLRAAWVSRKEELPLLIDRPFDITAGDLLEAARLIVAAR